jgi:hypothetical protein
VRGLINSSLGGLCGGVFIDEAFEEICKSRLGRHWEHFSKASIRDFMKGEWEYAIKPKFSPDYAQEEYIVALPAQAIENRRLDDTTRQPFIKNGRIHFKA